MNENGSGVLIANYKLKDVLAAFRVCGDTTIPMQIGLRMVKSQKRIKSELADIMEVNNSLIAEHGEKQNGGKPGVGPKMAGWSAYIDANAALMDLEVDLGEPYVLYQKESGDDIQLCWTEDMKHPIVISANVIVDMDDMLVIVDMDEKGEDE